MIIKSVAISGLLALAGSVMVSFNGVEESQLDGKLSVFRFESLGKQMRIARQLKKITQGDMAGKLQISAAELQQIESGHKIPVKEIVYNAENILKTTFISDEAYQDIKPWKAFWPENIERYFPSYRLSPR